MKHSTRLFLDHSSNPKNCLSDFLFPIIHGTKKNIPPKTPPIILLALTFLIFSLSLRILYFVLFRLFSLNQHLDYTRRLPLTRNEAVFSFTASNSRRTTVNPAVQVELCDKMCCWRDRTGYFWIWMDWRLGVSCLKERLHSYGASTSILVSNRSTTPS